MTNNQGMAKDNSEDLETTRAHWLFGCLIVFLIVLVGVYLFLHCKYPSKRLQPPEAEVRDKALVAIQQVSESLKDLANNKIKLDVAEKALDPIRGAIKNNPQLEKLNDEVEKYAESLTQMAEDERIATIKKVINENRRSDLGKYFGSNNQTMKGIEEEMAYKKPNERVLKVLFLQLNDEFKSKRDGYFWSTGPWRWAEFLFWSWLGVVLYLLMNISKFYPKTKSERRFREFTLWYVSAFLKGPVIALLVMFFIISISAGISESSIKFDLGEARIEVLIFLAGVLGFFSRVAQAQLEILVEKVFPQAWRMAQEAPLKLKIEPSSLALELGDKKQFTVVPSQDVVWSYEPKLGKLTEEGTYTAPTEEDKVGQEVTIKATSATDTSKSTTAKVILKKKVTLKVEPASLELGLGEEQSFKVVPEEKVTWSLEPEGLGEIAETGAYKAPIEESNAGQEVTIKATLAADSTKSATAKVTLKKKGEVRPLALEPSSVMLELGEKKQFTVTPPDQEVKWSCEPQLGTLTEKGLYSAPTEGDKAGQEVTIKATLATDSTKSATAKATLKKKFEIQPSEKQLKFKEQQQFTVEGWSDIEWSCAPSGMGSVDATGLYKAPETRPQGVQPGEQVRVTITAKAKELPSKAASAAVTLAE